MSMTTRLCLWRCGFHLTDLLHLLHLTSLISFLSSLFYLSDSLPLSPQHLFFFSESENTARVLLCDFCLVCLNLERLNEFMHASVFNGASLFSENARGREPARTVECVCVLPSGRVVLRLAQRLQVNWEAWWTNTAGVCERKTRTHAEVHLHDKLET